MALFIESLIAQNPSPNRIAFRWGVDGQIDQHRAANIRDGFAGWLQTSGVAAGQRVAFILPKGPAAAIALFATFQIGAVAIVLDAEAPAQRLTGMIADFQPVLIVTSADLEHLFHDMPRCLVVSDVNVSECLPQTGKPKPVSLYADHPALMLTTSGSTGRPKGVLLSHGNLTTFIDWAIATFDLQTQDRFVSLAPLHFDLSILDVYASQRVGAEVYLATAAQSRMAGAIARLTDSLRPTVLYTVPTQIQILSQLGFFTKSPGARDLRVVLSAGETLTSNLAAKLREAMPDLAIANLYGPTETNVVSCHFVGPDIDQTLPAIPIGRPCHHADCTILSGPETGVLKVEGPTVMLGYVTGPHDPEAQQTPRQFDTGDLVRCDPDGILHFLGRTDGQVKLRGFRIELEEIERVALSHSGVATAAAVIVHKTSPRPLLILGISVESDDVTADALFATLENRLPSHSVPDRVELRDKLPLTSTGKIDRMRFSKDLEHGTH